MDDLKTALAECLALHGKALRGPWQADPNTPGDVNGPDGKDVAVMLYAGMKAIEIEGDEMSLAEIDRETAEANAASIAALHNLFHDHGEKLLGMERDAARYAWLRQFARERSSADGTDWRIEHPALACCDETDEPVHETLDAAIDAAMEAGR